MSATAAATESLFTNDQMIEVFYGLTRETIRGIVAKHVDDVQKGRNPGDLHFPCKFCVLLF